ncbi:MAG: FG-GAP-like repeat-containing protein, partial [Acidobacteriia bacterium]|nr:FG-GAP-like repeat-containing protein [Terriglobia bacterium]
CNDGNACTQTDTCQTGVCVGSNPVVCTALDQCHEAGICDPGTGICTNPDKPNDSTCNDGNACTQTDTCQTGVCVGSNPVVCTALDQCHEVGVCDTGTGICSNPAKPNDSACNDGNACTQTDTCQTGVCVGSNPVVCTALDQCHEAGVCDTGTGICSNPEKPNDSACNDGNACTQTDTCQTGVCVGSNPVVCTALDQCHEAGVCDTGTGICSNPDKPNDSACNDGNACTQTDTCQTGVCVGSNPVVCTALDQCHEAGVCDTGTGICSNPAKPNDSACNDGNACTQTDTCQTGVCVGSNPVVCTALDQCHDAGVCDTGTGICTNPAKPNDSACNDGNACTQTDTCQTGVCVGSNPVVCTALDQCHEAGVCDTGTGICSNPEKPNDSACNDGNACTQTDTCQTGVCVGSNPVSCTPLDQCHEAGVCDTGTGICSNPEKPNDSACNDGNACTQTDTCQTGVCVGSNPVVCTALDQCHEAGVCDTGTGICSNPDKPNDSSCNDGNACTQTDTCQTGVCIGSNSVNCTALDQCHEVGVCDTGTGICSNPDKPNDSACNDGNACTQTDTCQTGVCIGSNPVSCTPLDQCHEAGVCDTGTGICTNPARANGWPCSDANACTQSDTCQAGACVGSNPVVCTPLDQCHDAGVCDPATGVCSNPAGGVLVTYYRDADGDGFGNSGVTVQACTAPEGYVAVGGDCNDWNPAVHPPGFTCGVLADFDGNGHPDILWRNATTGQIGAWRMNGAVHIGWISMPTEPPSSGWQIQGVGDFDGNGSSDLLWRNTTTGQVRAWLMNGSTIVSTASMPTERPTSGWQIQGVGDFNADGKPDVLWRNTTTGQVGAWLMNGVVIDHWVWMPTEPPTSGWQIQGVGDFNADGNSDVLWRNATTGQVGAWLMNGSAIASWAWMPTEPPSSGWQIRTVVDLNGDGGSEVVWRNVTTGQVGAWLMNGTHVTGWAWMPTEPPSSGWQIQGPHGPLVTFYRDADGDGYGNPAVTVQAYAAPAGYVAVVGDCNDANPAVHPGASDANCNGIDDDCNGSTDEGYVPQATSCGVAVCASTGVTSCVGGVVHDSCVPGTPTPEVCDGIDNDCDGVVDNGVLTTFYRDVDGDGYGNPAVTVQTCTAPAGYVAAGGDCNDWNLAVHPPASSCGVLSDFNGDGHPDILWRNATTDEVKTWRMNGTVKIGESSLGTAPSSDWQIQGVGDFDGNGSSDVLWRVASTGQVRAWLMNGSTIASTASMPTEPPTSGWQIQGVGDFNADGKPDVLWRNSTTGQVGAWLMNGVVIDHWVWMPREPPTSGWQIQGVGDFNADGNSDVLWRNTTTGQVGAWLMNGSTVASWAWMPTEPLSSGWQIQAVVDLTGDGGSEVVWRNATTGQVGAWLMNGTHVSGWAWMPTEPPSSGWQIQGREELLEMFCKEVVGDGYGEPAVTVQAYATPAGHVALGRRSDDADPAMHPGPSDGK